MNKNCKYCHETFIARRRNHLYCCSSCKTMASYKRNNYKYVSGHYKKAKNKSDIIGLDIPNPSNEQITRLEDKIELLEKNSSSILKDIKTSTAGTLIADASVYGLKKVLAPNTLPATKGDVEILKKQINELKFLINRKNNSFF